MLQAPFPLQRQQPARAARFAEGVPRLGSYTVSGSVCTQNGVPAPQPLAVTNLVFFRRFKTGLAGWDNNWIDDGLSLGRVGKWVVGSMVWAARFHTTVTTYGVAMSVCGVTDSASEYQEIFQVNTGLGGSSVAGSLYLQLRDDAGNFINATTGDVDINDEAVHTVSFFLESGTTVRCWVDGVEKSITYSSSGTVATGAGITEYPLWLLSHNLRGAGADPISDRGALYDFVRIPHGNARLAEALSRDILSVYEPEGIWVPSAAASLPTLSSATYVPGSITSVGFRPRVTAS